MTNTTLEGNASRRRTGARRILLITALALASAAAVAFALAPAADAQINCGYPTTMVCLYEHPGYTGRVVAYEIGDDNMGDLFGPKDFSNKASAIRNNSPFTFCAYDAVGLTGPMFRIDPGMSLDYVGHTWNDKFSSITKC
jgi:hypothetical protein